jgi:hypothetical protein
MTARKSRLELGGRGDGAIPWNPRPLPSRCSVRARQAWRSSRPTFRCWRKSGARRSAPGWTERLRRALVHYTEDCEAANMEVSDRGHSHHL